jgi:hypothetical protein
VRAPPVILVAALLLSGCGGGGGDDGGGPPDGAPKPRESLQSVLPAYEKAAAEQDCRGFARFVHSAVRPPGRGTDDPPDAEECANLAGSYVHLEDFKAEKTREYGTAAIVDGRIAGQRMALVWTVDVDRRWKQVQATPPGAAQQIGGVARPGGNRFAEHARQWVEAQRSGDCRKAFPLFNSASPFVTQDENDRRRFCDRFERGRRVATTLSYALAHSPAAKPVELGVTPNFAFYALATTGGGYWTVIMSTLPPALPVGGHLEDSVLDYYPNRRPKG